MEYLLEWDVNDAFYDFPFVGNSVTFEKTAPETMNVAYDEDLYQKDLSSNHPMKLIQPDHLPGIM